MDRRTTLFASFSGDHASERRGDHWLFASGIVASGWTFLAPGTRTLFASRIGSFGLSRRSYLTPAVIVSDELTYHWSWAKNASSFWFALNLPASSTVLPFRPTNSRYCVHWPARKAAFRLAAVAACPGSAPKMKTP